MTIPRIEPYRVSAYNTARAAENKIHDDEVARKFGFGGGLVPGVDVYGYMTHAPVGLWGRAWLERGSAECRFLQPVYDGETATVTAHDAEGGIAIEVASRGALCASGHAALPSGSPVVPALDEFADRIPPATRPPADEITLAAGNLLAIRPLDVSAAFAAQYLEDLRETDPLYRRDGLAHPGMILRTLNWALTHNVVLGPWIHVGSKVQNFSTVCVGETISACARVVANYERKGHRFVELDGLVVADRARPVARISHTAIYRPRQVAAA
jgi:acyl dehydratase